MTIERLDATSAATTPFTPSPEHRALSELTGRWRGDTRTTFDPDAAPEESTTTATIDALLGGRWIRIDYQGTAMGQPHAGVLLLGFHRDAQAYEATWIDSFHTGTAMMLSVGAPRPDGLVSVLGSYAAGPERWGWRTTLKRPTPDELILESINISPAGQEFPAVETHLHRT